MASGERRRFGFLSPQNFKRAFVQIQRSRSDLNYKAFYRHLLDAYDASLDENVRNLIEDIRNTVYEPKPPVVLHQPKRLRGVRPKSLLSLDDLIVYQALVNVVADALQGKQRELAGVRRFGGLYAGPQSPWFIRRWEEGYDRFTDAIVGAFDAGNHVVGDFDLASYYDVIDHQLLRERVQPSLDDEEALTWLFDWCLPVWTSATGKQRRHGIPQGPEASIFLAEILLFDLDAEDYEGATYLRYIDDIKLMAPDRGTVDRGLLKLELRTRALGLVPQSGKIGVSEPMTAGELTKTLPSAVLAAADDGDEEIPSQAVLGELLRASVSGRGRNKTIQNETWFKYAINRLNPTRATLRYIAPLIASRPDLASTLTRYVSRFGRDREAALLLVNALSMEPPYAGAHAAIIEGLSVAEPRPTRQMYARAVDEAQARSLEPEDPQLGYALTRFRAARVGPEDAAILVGEYPQPLIRGRLMRELFLLEDSPHKPQYVKPLLEALVEHDDGDLARFAASHLVSQWHEFGDGSWNPGRRAHESVRSLLYSLHLRARRGSRKGVLKHFFWDVTGIRIDFPWKKRLGADFADLEEHCAFYLLQRDPIAKLFALDSLNDGLTQTFSKAHPTLSAEFTKMAGKKQSHPQFGTWLRKSGFNAVLPDTAAWFLEVNEARNRNRAAHYRGFSGARQRSRFTHADFDTLFRRHRRAWTALLINWPGKAQVGIVPSAPTRQASASPERRAGTV